MKPVSAYSDIPILWSRCHVPLAGGQALALGALSLELAPELAELELYVFISGCERGQKVGAPSSTLAVRLRHNQTT